MDEAGSFGQWLRKHRRGLDLTQNELARRAGCAAITIKKLEADQLRPSKELAQAVLRQLGAAPDELEALVRFARGGTAPSSWSPAPPKGNLPAQLTSFIGREREVAQIRKAISEHRLVTLTGVGGTGKSRLSLEVAAQLEGEFPDGIWLVELAPVSDPAVVSQAAVSVLGLSDRPGRQPLEILTDYLAGKRLLLILDNCEHLLDECGRVAQALLQAASTVRVLATSREPLNIAGEQAYRVPSLEIPNVQELPRHERLREVESVRLFVDRAVLVSPGFVLTEKNGAAVAQVCYQLDGIPLALELAAARLGSLSLDVLVSHLGDRFRLLTGGSRTALPRHRTLRAAIDWSYELLSAPEQLLLQRLSVFRGGCTLEAAEAASTGQGIERVDVLDLLSGLVRKSLLLLDERGRYRMLETVRQYAAEKLSESGGTEAARARQLEYMLELAEQAEPQVRGPDQLRWLDRLDAELDNLRAAIGWAEQQDAESFLRLASALWRFWDTRVGNSEVIEWLDHGLAGADPVSKVYRARAAARLAHLHFTYVTNKAPLVLAKTAYGLSMESGDSFSQALALLGLAQANFGDNQKQACAYAEQALALSEGAADHWIAVLALEVLAEESIDRSDLLPAGAYYQRALNEARLSGDGRLIITALGFCSWLAAVQGDWQRSESLDREAWSIAVSLGDKRNVAFCRMNMGLDAICREDYPEAECLLDEACELARATGSRFNLGVALVNVPEIEFVLGNADRLLQRAQAALDLWQEEGDLIGVAWSEFYLGEGYRLKGEFGSAESHLRKSLSLFRTANWRDGSCSCLEPLGYVALSTGLPARAVRLLGARAALGHISTVDEFPQRVREREKRLAEARDQLDAQAFDAAWAQGQGMSEEQMWAYALEERPEPAN